MTTNDSNVIFNMAESIAKMQKRIDDLESENRRLRISVDRIDWKHDRLSCQLVDLGILYAVRPDHLPSKSLPDKIFEGFDKGFLSTLEAFSFLKRQFTGLLHALQTQRIIMADAEGIPIAFDTLGAEWPLDAAPVIFAAQSDTVIVED